MGLFFLETSALVKLYVHEPGTDRLLELAASPENHQFAILSVAQAEFRSAVRRRERAGDLDGATAAQLLEMFNSHQQVRFLRQGINDLVVDSACELIDRYPLRAYDALQLAGCLIFRAAAPDAPVFVCADRRLLNAAENEGLAGLNPTE